MSLIKSEEEESSGGANSAPSKSKPEPGEDNSNAGSDNGSSSSESVKDEYDQLCRELNMDESTMETAWKSYMAIRHNYTLEVSSAQLVSIVFDGVSISKKRCHGGAWARARSVAVIVLAQHPAVLGSIPR